MLATSFIAPGILQVQKKSKGRFPPLPEGDSVQRWFSMNSIGGERLSADGDSRDGRRVARCG
jgi:hypothetical protein